MAHAEIGREPALEFVDRRLEDEAAAARGPVHDRREGLGAFGVERFPVEEGDRTVARGHVLQNPAIACR